MSHFYTMQLTLPHNIQSTRWGHSVTAISLAPGLTEVTMFGGSSSLHSNDCIAAAATTIILSFGELKSLSSSCHMDDWEGGRIRISGNLPIKYLSLTHGRPSCERSRKNLV